MAQSARSTWFQTCLSSWTCWQRPRSPARNHSRSGTKHWGWWWPFPSYAAPAHSCTFPSWKGARLGRVAASLACRGGSCTSWSWEHSSWCTGWIAHRRAQKVWKRLAREWSVLSLTSGSSASRRCPSILCPWILGLGVSSNCSLTLSQSKSRLSFLRRSSSLETSWRVCKGPFWTGRNPDCEASLKWTRSFLRCYPLVTSNLIEGRMG